MKQIISLVCFASLAIGFVAREEPKPGIYGMIDPPEGAKKVWAISGNDSVSTIPVAGKFSMEVKAGNWTLIAEGIAPYKNTVMSNIMVLETQPTDAGIIKMSE